MLTINLIRESVEQYEEIRESLYTLIDNDLSGLKLHKNDDYSIVDIDLGVDHVELSVYGSSRGESYEESVYIKLSSLLEGKVEVAG